MNISAKVGIFLAVVFAIGGTLHAQAPKEPPLTEKEVFHQLKSGGTPAQLAGIVAQRGVDFDLTPEVEKKLSKAGADDALISAIGKAGPKSRVAQPAGPGGAQMSPEEIKDAQEIQNNLDPDREIQLVNDFEKKYPNSTWLTYAYIMGAGAYQTKGEAERVVEYAGKSLKLNADNLAGLVMMATMLPQPQLLHGGDADKEKKLSDAEMYANRAIQLAEKLPKQPNMTEEQLQKSKASLSSQIHAALGMVHLQRSSMGLTGPDRDELAKAEQEYKTAVTLSDRPDPADYYRLGEAYALDNKSDEALEAFSKASELGAGSQVKTYADQAIERLRAKKSAPNPPAKP